MLALDRAAATNNIGKNLTPFLLIEKQRKLRTYLAQRTATSNVRHRTAAEVSVLNFNCNAFKMDHTAVQ